MARGWAANRGPGSESPRWATRQVPPASYTVGASCQVPGTSQVSFSHLMLINYIFIILYNNDMVTFYANEMVILDGRDRFIGEMAHQARTEGR